MIKSYGSATLAEKLARIAEVESLRLSKGVELDRWSDPSQHHSTWADRGRLLASLVEADERVFEFGAGKSAVSSTLPPSCTYQGSDIAPVETNLPYYDLNASELQPVNGYDVAIFSGVLEYVHDLPRLAHFLSESFNAVVCSYCALGSAGDAEELSRRRYSGWFNDLTSDEFEALFVAADFKVLIKTIWNGQSIFRLTH